MRAGMGWLFRKHLILSLGIFPGTNSDVLLCAPPALSIRLPWATRCASPASCPGLQELAE